MKKKLLCQKSKRILPLPYLGHAKTAVLNTLESPESQRSYRFAIDDFIAWYCSEPTSSRETLVLYRTLAGTPCLTGLFRESAPPIKH